MYNIFLPTILIAVTPLIIFLVTAALYKKAYPSHQKKFHRDMDMLIEGKRSDPIIFTITLIMTTLSINWMTFSLATRLSSIHDLKEFFHLAVISLPLLLVMGFLTFYGSNMTSEVVMSFVKARRIPKEKVNVNNTDGKEQTTSDSSHDWISKLYGKSAK